MLASIRRIAVVVDGRPVGAPTRAADESLDDGEIMTAEPTTTPTPRVSVVMPAFDAAAFVATAIASLRAQTLTDWEAIVVDDASRDDTAAVVAAIARDDPRIRLLRQEANRGPAAARNAGLAAARGTWIALLDADDTYAPDRLAKLVAYGEREALDVVADNVWLKDPTRGVVVRSGLPRDGRVRDWTLRAHLTHEMPASGFVYGLLKPIVRRDFVERIGLRYRVEFRYGEDFLFYAELFLNGARGRILSEPGYTYVLPISEVDGARSDRSRTSMQASELVRVGDHLLATFADRLAPADVALLHLRARYLAHREAAEDLKAMRREGRYAAMLALVAERPFLLRFVLRGALWRLRAAWANHDLRAGRRIG